MQNAISVNELMASIGYTASPDNTAMLEDLVRQLRQFDHPRLVAEDYDPFIKDGAFVSFVRADAAPKLVELLGTGRDGDNGLFVQAYMAYNRSPEGQAVIAARLAAEKAAKESNDG